jgi:hypothetical protein
VRGRNWHARNSWHLTIRATTWRMRTDTVAGAQRVILNGAPEFFWQGAV